MKSKDIQRGITPRQFREEGEGPGLGRVSRLRDVELLTGDRRSRRLSGRGGPMDPVRRKSMLIWSAALSVITLAVMGVALSAWLSPRLRHRPVPEESLGIAGTEVRVASKFPSPSREQAMDLVKRAISNRDPDLVETLFRPGSASRAEILEFFENAEEREGLVESYDWLSSMDVKGLLMEGVLVVYPGKEKPVERLALLTPDAVGNWKLDFEAFARSARPSWREFLEGGAPEAVVRVIVAKDHYFNGPFSDEKLWVSYAISSPDIEETLQGYCRADSEIAEAMGKLFSDGRKVNRMTLELRRVEGSQNRQFEITRLIAEDWVIP